ncbi:hypothetical protein [Pleomorphomonas diazotrophica]|nr:hypothetical protein [Pleomorphomonas diazotrophica]
MKTVTFGDQYPTGDLGGKPLRYGRGEVEIEKVLKGSYSERTVPVYTGAGPGDCGRLGEFVNAAVYYDHETFGEFELGLTKIGMNGKTFYVSSMCDYAKGSKFEERPKVEEGGTE